MADIRACVRLILHAVCFGLAKLAGQLTGQFEPHGWAAIYRRTADHAPAPAALTASSVRRFGFRAGKLLAPAFGSLTTCPERGNACQPVPLASSAVVLPLLLVAFDALLVCRVLVGTSSAPVCTSGTVGRDRRWSSASVPRTMRKPSAS